jgi:hypothetical protein
MRDVGAAPHVAEDRPQPRVGKYLLCEDGEGVMHIVLWHDGSDLVQVSRSHVQKALSLAGGTLCSVCVLKKLDEGLIILQRSTT